MQSRHRAVAVHIHLLGWALLALCLTSLAWSQGNGSDVRPAVRAKVERILRQNSQKRRMTQPAELKAFGPNVVNELSTMLVDRNIGFDAANLMLLINPEKAGPLLFASMPKSDGNVRHRAFAYYTDRILTDKKINCVQAIHDAAVRCLTAKADAEEREALYALGLTGSKKDVPLLKKYAHNTHANPTWRTSLHRAAVAALARLGDRAALEEVTATLRKPIPTEPTGQQLEEISEAFSNAAYVQNRRLIPILAAHLHGPESIRKGCVIFAPALAAAQAMNATIHHAKYQYSRATVADWQAWWEKHKGEYPS